MYKRLFRSSSNRVIAGVCGGLGDYFAIDPNIIRIASIIFVFFPPVVLAYLVAWLSLPLDCDLIR